MEGDIGVWLLGGIEIRQPAGPVPVSGEKLQALVALLALATPHAVSSGRLIDELWGEDLPAHPTNALQAQVSQLRRVLGREAVPRRGQGYVLDVDPDAVDSVRFERLVGRARAAAKAGDHARSPRRCTRPRCRWSGTGPRRVGRLPLRPPGGVAARGGRAGRPRGPGRRQAGHGAPRRGGRGVVRPGAGPSAPRALPRPADRRPLPQRPPSRGPDRLPRRPQRARRGVRGGAGARAPGARTGGAGPGPGARRGRHGDGGARRHRWVAGAALDTGDTGDTGTGVGPAGGARPAAAGRSRHRARFACAATSRRC